MVKNVDLKEKYDAIFKEGAFSFFTIDGFEEAINIAPSCCWKDKRVIDIGSGEGRLASIIAGAGASKVVAIDYSNEAMKNAIEKFTMPNLQFVTGNYRDLNIKEKFDVVTMQGVMEHFDNPWDELKYIVDNFLEEGGTVITSSPSFLNPRGYVWMTLAKLFDVPMSLTDLHFICPFDMQDFCEEHGYSLEYESIYQDWGCGELMLNDLNKRLRNALRDANMDNSKVADLIAWLSRASEFFTKNETSGAMIVYRIRK